ncbi:MAG: Tm-1-like ATP-binding domain-containing protein [Bacteroidota bacterium]
MQSSPHSPARKTVLMLGCFDTKAEDFAYLRTCLLASGVEVISLNTGVRGSGDFPVDIEADRVANETDMSLEELNKHADRSLVVEKMGQGAAQIIARLLAEGSIDGAIGMGGGGGTYITLLAMQAIPIGIPKFCISTIASKDLSRQMGNKDVVLMPSIVDIAGLNVISRLLIKQAAGAICGMVQATESISSTPNKPSIAISMFGNTTVCVEKCKELLNAEGFEVLAFHAVGVGGKTMESLIEDGFFVGVLDITTTELADELCDGICSAGPERLTAASLQGIPQVVVPGCLDMVNYGHLDTVPERFTSRQLFSWAPDVTLMRTNEEENRILGISMAEKLNRSQGEVAVLLPTKGISKVSSEGGVFHNPEVDQVLFGTLKQKLKPNILIEEVETHINDEAFAKKAVDTLLNMLTHSK